MNNIDLKFVIPIEIYKDAEYNKLRRMQLILISNIFDEMFVKLNIADSSYYHVQTIVNIEKSCYDHAVETAIQNSIMNTWSHPLFEHIYRSKIIRITKNIDSSSEVNDTYLFNHIIDKSNTFDVNNISKLRPEELSPKTTQMIIKNFKDRMNQKLTYRTTSLYTCKNCKKNICRIKSIQLRSLDEGENISLTCDYCNNHWIL